METIRLLLEAPFFCSKKPLARIFGETFDFPPPFTLYNMFLSAIGETDITKHAGSSIAIARLSMGPKSVLGGKIWKVGDGHKLMRGIANKEIYTNLRASVWVKGSLASAVKIALLEPENVDRYGVLSIGESFNIVNDLHMWTTTDGPNEGSMLIKDKFGPIGLPIWSQHVGTQCKWEKFDVVKKDLGSVPEEAWVTIEP